MYLPRSYLQLIRAENDMPLETDPLAVSLTRPGAFCFLATAPVALVPVGPPRLLPVSLPCPSAPRTPAAWSVPLLRGAVADPPHAQLPLFSEQPQHRIYANLTMCSFALVL